MKTIDGKTLKEMFVSASNNLYNHYPEVDALNVFPVPDGDTGMNMSMTMTNGAKFVKDVETDDVYTVANTFAKGLLMGARGNSGVITSQIFRGFAQSLEGKKTISAPAFAEAFKNGAKVAYKAVIRPVEGTILTVVREASAALNDYADSSIEIEQAMEKLLSEAKKSLKRTPDLLPVLKEVGVVDSGGAGLVKIFEGMLSFLKGKFIEREDNSSHEKAKVESPIGDMDKDDEFGYCTEFIMRLGPAEEKEKFDEQAFKATLIERGNSIVVVRDDDIVKVHIHTLNPGNILTFAQSYGEFVTIKVENMTEQHSKLQTPPSLKKKEEEQAAPVKTVPTQQYGLVAISAGKGIDEMFTAMGANEIVSGGQTMNPSIEDIANACRKCNAKTVYVFPNNSNIVMAAVQAADVLSDEFKVYVVPTKTIPQGIAACSVFNEDVSPAENFKTMKEELKNIHSGSVTYAIKDTKMNGVEVKKDYFMGIYEKKIISCHKRVAHALYDLLDAMVNEETFLITVLVGADINDERMNNIAEKITKKYENIEIDIRRGDQPVYSFLVGVE